MLNEVNEVQSRKAKKTQKMRFKNIKDVLSRDEMKGIMAGSGNAYCNIQVRFGDGTSYIYSGYCASSNTANCEQWGYNQCTTAFGGSCVAHCF